MPPSDLSDLLGIPVGDPGLAASGHRWRLGRSAATPAGYPERRAAGGRSIHADRSGQGRSLPSLYPDRQSSLSFDGSGDVQAQRHVRRGKSLGPGRSLRSVEHPQLWPDPEQRPRAGCALSTVAPRLSADRARGPAGCGGHLVAFLRAQDRADLLARSVTSSRAAVDLAEDIAPAEIKAEMRQRARAGATCWPPQPTTRRPRVSRSLRPRFPDWCPRVDGKVGAK
jgi:hypothetical protein